MAGQAAVTIRGKQWSVSLAVAPWELTKGLGGLPGIPAATGMLFDMGMSETIQVTTVPMLFPLDIAFLSDTLVITEVYRDIQPDYLVTSTSPARYFLEVNAGDLEGIDAGDKAVVEVIAPAQAAAPDWASTLFGFMGFMVIGIFTVSLVKDLVKGIFGEPEKRPELLPQTRRQGKFIVHTDRMANIIITHSERPKRGVFLQFESDKEMIYDMLKKSEREDLDKGWNVEVKDAEPRASLLQELWETSVESEELPRLSQTVGNQKLMVWVRYGDVSHYFDFDSPYDAGKGVGIILALYPAGELSYRYLRAGVEVKPFYTGRNYILLFWGDAKAQWQQDLSELERKEFERGVKDIIASVPDRDGCHTSQKFLPQTAMPDSSSVAGEEEETTNEDKIEVVIVDRGPRHKLVKIYKRGRVYAATYAEPFPTKESALADYLRNPRNFKPFDESSMTYLPMVGKNPNPNNRPAVIRVESPKKGTCLEFLADSPEFLTQTIEDIGYRERIDSAFQKAISRARQGSQP